MKYLRLFFVILAILAAVPAVGADMMDPRDNLMPSHNTPSHMTFVDSCFEITNLDQYPDYVFILIESPYSGSYHLISARECIPERSVSKPYTDTPEIHAIKMSDYASVGVPSEYDKRRLHSFRDVFEPSMYFNNNKPNITINYFLKISSLNDTGFNISRERWTVSYSNGSTFSYPTETLVPVSLLSTPVAEIPLYLSLSFIAGALITVILLWRRKNV